MAKFMSTLFRNQLLNPFVGARRKFCELEFGKSKTTATFLSDEKKDLIFVKSVNLVSFAIYFIICFNGLLP